MIHRLSIITTHPIQYNAPFFKALAQSGEVKIKVFYTWDAAKGSIPDPGFRQQIKWDIPLLEGYPYAFVKNTAKDPGSHHFRGIQNPTLIDEIEKERPDALLIYGWHFQSHLKAMRHFKGKIPVWFRGDSHLLDYEFRTPNNLFEGLKRGEFCQTSFRCIQCLKFTIRRFVLTRIYRHIDKAFYVGTHNKGYYLAHGLKEEQLIYLPHVVDHPFFAYHHEQREMQALEWRRSLGIADHQFVVLFAGKLIPKKNPELLIRTVIKLNESILKDHAWRTGEEVTDNALLSILNKEQRDVERRIIHLILVGDGILKSQLYNLAGDKPYIHFLPFQNQSQMPVVYRLGNVYCLPSISETWGLGVNEALSCGSKAIVSDKVGCAADLINDKNGYIFSNNDEISLGKAIDELYHTESKNIETGLLPDNFTLIANVNKFNRICHS